MKMYFLVNSDLPVGNAINSIAHGSMMSLLKWGEEEVFRSWLSNSFKKVTCEAASPEEFEEAKKLGTHIVVTESALAGKETVLVFYPSEERLPFKLYRR